MLAWLTDPKVFNYVLLTLYTASALRWAWAGSWFDVLYWTGATFLTIGVTFR